jgi:8-oxo-dGTP diphosphatase
MKKTPLLVVDILIEEKGKILLVKRKNPPFRGYYAIPGGFVEYGERVEDAARREAKEETGLDVELERITGIYSDPERDPRGHVVSICYLARVVGGKMKGGSDAEETRWFPLDKLPKLAFDHERIIRDAF